MPAPGGSHPQPRAQHPSAVTRNNPPRTNGRSRCVPKGGFRRRSAPVVPRSRAIAPSRVPGTSTSPTRSSSSAWCWRGAIACARRPAATAGARSPARRECRHPDIARLIIKARMVLAGIDPDVGRLRAAERGFRPRWPRSVAASAPRPLRRRRTGRPRRAAQGPRALRRSAAAYRRALPLVAAAISRAATLAHNLGGIEHARGSYGQAEPHARRSVRLRTGCSAVTRPSRPTSRRWRRSSRRAAAWGGGSSTVGPSPCSGRLGPRSLEVGLELASLAAVEQRRRRLAQARSSTAGDRHPGGSSAGSTPRRPDRQQPGRAGARRRPS